MKKITMSCISRFLSIGITLLTLFSCNNELNKDRQLNITNSTSRSVEVGETVSIYSNTSQMYIGLNESSELYSTSSVVTSSEKFIVEDSLDGYIYLLSVSNGKYLSITNSNSIIVSDSTTPGDSSKFRFDTRSDGSTAIFAYNTATYVNVNTAESNVIKAQWNDLDGGWQAFTINSVSNLIIGADLSEALYAQNSGVNFKDQYGVDKDVVQIFEDNGYTWVRVRVNIEPDNTDYAMFTDLEYAKELGAIVKSKGLKLLIDFHYSKWWADPENQWAPLSWITTDINVMNNQVYTWTKDAMTELINAGASPDMVQIGNEINDGLLWDLGNVYHGGSWANVATMINSGINGVKDTGSDADIMLHTATGGSWSQTGNWIENFINAGGDWGQVDAFGLSYYSMWHGTLSDLSNNLENLANSYGDKDIYIVETAYYWDTNQVGNTGSTVPYPQTEQGQYDYLQDVKSVAEYHENVAGIFYWGAAWSVTGSWLVAPDWSDDDASRRSLFNDSGRATLGIRGLID